MSEVCLVPMDQPNKPGSYWRWSTFENCYRMLVVEGDAPFMLVGVAISAYGPEFEAHKFVFREEQWSGPWYYIPEPERPQACGKSARAWRTGNP